MTAAAKVLRGVRIAMVLVAAYLVSILESACASRDLPTGDASGVNSNAAPEVSLATTFSFAVHVASSAAMRGLDFPHRSLIDRRGRPTVDLSGPEATAQVDEETGILVGYHELGTFRHRSVPSQEVTAEQALASARAFAERACVSPNAWCLREETYLDNGVGDRKYSIELERVFDGVGLPAAIDAFVDAENGDVFLFSLYDDPVAIPLRPRISMDQAAAVVDARMGYLHPVAQRAELIVWYRPTYPGRQVLLWSFENICDASAPADTDPFPVARVDAMTGELLDLPVADEIAAPGTKHSTEQVKGGSPSKPAPLHIKVLIEIDLAALKNATAPPTVFQTARARKH